MSVLGAPYLAVSGHTAGSSPISLTVTASTQQGDAIAVWVTTNAGSIAAGSVTDTQGNTYTLAGAVVTKGAFAGAWMLSLNSAALTAGTDKITFSNGATSGGKTLTAYGCAGILQAAAVDQAPAPTTAFSVSPSISSGALAQSSELALAGLVNAAPGGVVVWGGSFAAPLLSASESPGANEMGQSAVITTASAAALTASGTITGANWGMELITLQSQNPASAARVGTTVPNLALSTGPCVTNPSEGCYDAGMTQAQADQRFTTAVGRSLNGTGHLAVTKKFWTTPGDYSLTKNAISQYLTFGTKILFALTPPFSGGTAADQTALANFLTALKGMGFNSSNCCIILWQEPEGAGKFAGGPSQYQTQMAFFGPVVNASGLPLAQDIGMGGGSANAVNWLNAGYAAGVTFAVQYHDYYFSPWNRGVTLDAVAAIADAQGLPLGLGEFGSHVGDDNTGYMGYIRQFFTARIQAGKPITDVCRYEGQCSLAGTGDLTSPILSSSDPRAVLYQQIFDALTTTGRAANTVTVTNPGTQANLTGDTVALQITGADSDPSQTLSYAATGLPPGLVINSTTGLITGNPTTAGNYSVTVTATDGTGAAGSAGFAWTVNRVVTNTVTVTSPGNQASQTGATVTLPMTATDSAAGQTLTWTAAGLPPGLAIAAATGRITGNPTTAGNYSVTVTATDTTGSFGTATFTWTVAASRTLPAGKFTNLPPITPSPVGGLGGAGQLSYELAFGLIAGQGATVPFAAVTLQFFDFDQAPLNQTPVAQVTYRCPMGTPGDPNGSAVVYGRGPMRGAYMRVQIHNVDTADAILDFFQLVGVARTITRDDWRWDSGGNSPVIPGYTNASAATASLILGGISNLAIPHGTTVSRLFSMFAGSAYLRVHLNSGGPASIGVNVGPQPPSLFSNQNLLNKTAGNAGDDNIYTLVLPRGPCQVSFVGDPATDATISAEMIALEP